MAHYTAAKLQFLGSQLELLLSLALHYRLLLGHTGIGVDGTLILLLLTIELAGHNLLLATRHQLLVLVPALLYPELLLLFKTWLLHQVPALRLLGLLHSRGTGLRLEGGDQVGGGLLLRPELLQGRRALLAALVVAVLLLQLEVAGRQHLAEGAAGLGGRLLYGVRFGEGDQREVLPHHLLLSRLALHLMVVVIARSEPRRRNRRLELLLLLRRLLLVQLLDGMNTPLLTVDLLLELREGQAFWFLVRRLVVRRHL